MASVASELGPCLADYWWTFRVQEPPPQEERESIERQHAIRLRDALTRLGPAFVKGGQQLSIRPDLVPATVLKELQKLCDAVKPIPDEVAMEVIKEELNCSDLSTIFSDLHLVASASLVSEKRNCTPRLLAHSPHAVGSSVQSQAGRIWGRCGDQGTTAWNASIVQPGSLHAADLGRRS